MREINERFISDLKNGCLSYFLNQVKEKSDKLCLAIRDGYINIYYMGGNLLRITQKQNGYSFYFDAKYCLNKGDDKNFDLLNSLDSNSVQDYIDNFELMMKEMESWLEAHPKKERIYQHKLLANNKSVIDIEYATPKSKLTGIKLNMRLDMLMVDNDKLIIVENKYGTGAVTGSAGVSKHYEDICNLLNTKDLYDELIVSVEKIEKAKYELGLLENQVQKIDKSKTEILFLFADFNFNSDTLKNEVKLMDITYPFKVLYMDSNDSKIDLNKVEIL